jgi:hypothetical protein
MIVGMGKREEKFQVPGIGTIPGTWTAAFLFFAQKSLYFRRRIRSKDKRADI